MEVFFFFKDHLLPAPAQMIQLEPTHSILSRLQTVPGTRVSQTQLKPVLLTQAIAQGPSTGGHLLTGQVFSATLSTQERDLTLSLMGVQVHPSRCAPSLSKGQQPVTSSSAAAAAAPCYGSLSQTCHSEAGGSGLGHFLPWRLLEELATGSTLGAERADAIREGAASGAI